MAVAASPDAPAPSTIGRSAAALLRRVEVKVGRRLDGLLLAGLTPRGARLVQAYLDRTGDVLTAAVCGIYILRAAQLEALVRQQQQQLRYI